MPRESKVASSVFRDFCARAGSEWFVTVFLEVPCHRQSTGTNPESNHSSLHTIPFRCVARLCSCCFVRVVLACGLLWFQDSLC